MYADPKHSFITFAAGLGLVGMAASSASTSSDVVTSSASPTAGGDAAVTGLAKPNIICCTIVSLIKVEAKSRLQCWKVKFCSNTTQMFTRYASAMAVVEPSLRFRSTEDFFSGVPFVSGAQS
jgi:hypothetical protein